MPRRRNAGRKNTPRGPTRRTESSSAFVRASMSRVRRSQVAQRASIPSGAVPAVHEASSASRRGVAQVGVSSQASSQVAPRRRAAASAT